MERHIAEHCIERNQNFKENGALRAGENDYNANGDERCDIFEELPSEREEIPTWPNSAWQVLRFRRDKKIVVYCLLRKVVIGTQFDHSSESSRRIVHRTGSLCGPQASQEVNH